MSAATFAKRLAKDAQNISVLERVLKSLMKTKVASSVSVPRTETEAVMRSMMIRLLISCSVKPMVYS